VSTLPRYFDGLDVAQGIRHADGNTAVYIEILKEFIVVYGESAQMMRNLADEHSYVQMKQLCVDMRNLTHTIGAYKVHEIADEIYKLLLYNNEHQVSQYIEAYKRAFEKLKHMIEEYVEGSVKQ